MTEAAESDAVLAFIRDRQGQVLADGIRQLTGCPPDELADVAHAVSGALGSYQLAEAYDAVMRLRSVLDDPGSSQADIALARESTLTDLLRVQREAAP